MNAMKRRTAVFCLIGSLVTGCVAGAAEPVALETLLPPDVLCYCWSAGIRQTEAQMSKSGMSRLWAEPPMQAFFHKTQDRIRDFLAEGSEEMLARLAEERGWDEAAKEAYRERVRANLAPAHLAEVFAGPVALALWRPADGAFDSLDDLSLAVVADVSGKADAAAVVLDLLAETLVGRFDVETSAGPHGRVVCFRLPGVPDTAPRLQRMPVTFGLGGGVMVAGTHPDAVAAVLAARQTPLSQNLTVSPVYKALQARAHAPGLFFQYIDLAGMERCLPMLDTPIEPASVQGGPALTARRIMEVLGVSGVRSLAAWMNVDGDGEMRQTMFAHVPGEKAGVVGLLHGNAAVMSVPDFLPANTALYEAFRLSPAAALQVGSEVAESLRPGSAEKVQQALEGMRAQLGVDVVNGVLEALGDEVGMALIAPSAPVQDVSGMSVMMAQMMLGMQSSSLLVLTSTVEDAAVLEASLSTVLSSMASQSPMMAGMSQEEYNGATIHRLGGGGGAAMPGMPQPALAVFGDRAFFALQVDTLKAVLDAHAGKTPRLNASTLCRTAAAKLEARPATGFVCMNLAEYMAWYSGFVKQMLQVYSNQMRQRMMAADAALGQGDPDDWGGHDAEDDAETPVVVDDPISRFVDFALWPQPALFQKHLGVTMSQFHPVEDGFLILSVTASPPAP